MPINKNRMCGGNKMLFSQRLKELRNESFLSQNELAQSLKYAQSNICEWEKGTVEPRASALLAIADFFQVSTDYLLGRTDDFGNLSVQNSVLHLPAEATELMNAFCAMTHSQRIRLVAYAEGMLENTNRSHKRNA